MKVTTEILSLPFLSSDNIPSLILKAVKENEPVLRWGVVRIEQGTAFLEIARVCDSSTQSDCILWKSASKKGSRTGLLAALIVPTGVGAEIGGYIGDAGPTVRAFEEVVDGLIVHPNVVNAASFYGGGSKCIYMDGLTLDRFLAGGVQLGDRAPKKIGLLIDRLEPHEQRLIINTTNGLRSVHGVEIIGYVSCAEKIGARVSISQFGHFIGELDNLDVLLAGASILSKCGAEAIAVVTKIGGFSEQDVSSHYAGNGVNPVGALEALISRAITWHTGLPCAHGPFYSNGIGQTNNLIDPRAAAEVASHTGLPCLIQGLLQSRIMLVEGGTPASELAAVIVPAECSTGLPAIAACRLRVPILAVRSNRCVVGARIEDVGVEGVTVVENYAEALAYLCCLKAGITWESFSNKIGNLRRVGEPLN